MNRMTVEYLALPRKCDFIIRQTNKKMPNLETKYNEFVSDSQ